MKKVGIGVAVCLLAAAVAAPAAAHRDMRAGYGSGPGNVADIAEEQGLDLTAEQREQIHALREAHLKDIKPLQDHLHVKSRELRGLWLGSAPDRESILPLQREVRALRRQLMEKLRAYRQEVRQILTPEQREKIWPRGVERGPWRMGGPGMGDDPERGRGTGPSPSSGGGVAP